MGWIELSSELDMAHHKFMEIANQLDASIREKEGVCGRWSPKDVIAHLIGWDTEIIYALDLFARGDGETYDNQFDIDNFNKQSVNSRKNLTWGNIMNDLSQAHKGLQEIVIILNEKNMESSSGFGQALVGRKNDYEVHTNQFLNWLTK